MRQKENLETFLESLLLTEDQFKTDGNHSHTSLPPLSHIQRYQMSPLPLDPTSTIPSHQVTHDIVEIKTLLVKVKTLLEKESLEDQIKQLKEELNNKNNKIEALEKIINTKKETVATQTRRTQPAAARLVGRRVSPAKSLHNISISHVSSHSSSDRHSPGPGHHQAAMKPCQHSWRPCANDHSYHHARSHHTLSSHTRPVSPWSPTSSSSSGSFHDTVRYKRLEMGKYKKRALST